MALPTARTWAEIHLDRLSHNYHEIRRHLAPGVKYLGLVKANAYGHGAVPVARRLQELGADYLAVACLSEAEELRAAGITAPILCLGYTDPADTTALIAGNITQAIYDQELARAFSARAQALGTPLQVHLKIDTGMSRLGFLCDEGSCDRSVALLAELARLPGLKAEGLFAHFAVADTATADCVDYSRLQLERFQRVRRLLARQGIHFPLCHTAASAALLNYPDAHFDLVRPGIIQFGLEPDPSMVGCMALQPVMELKTRIASIKAMPRGTTISYGRSYTLQRDSRIAVVPIGYGDGLFRLLSNRQEMLVRGQRVPQLGRVCMDMCMLDVTELPEVALGDVVTVFGDGLPLQEKATTLGTITYELVCDIAPRVPRVYLG